MTRFELRRMTLCLLVVFGMLLAPPLTGTLSAQEEDEPVTTYTRVALWEVGRDDWGSFVEFFEKYEQPIVEKLFAKGLITEWGIDAAGLHKPDGYTHSTWYSASSMSALVKAGEAYAKEWEAQGSDVDAEFNAMVGRHRDYVMETEGMRANAATLDGGYFHGHSVKLTRDKVRGFMSYWEHRMKPIYEQLLTDGVITAYGISSEAIVTGHPMHTSWWYVMADADGFDKVDAAFDASWDGMDKEGRRARWVSIMDTVDEDSYRSWVAAIIHMQVADH